MFEYSVLKDGWLKMPIRKSMSAKSKNSQARLLLGLNQLLLRIAGKTVLIDVGLGNKHNPEELGLIDFQKPRGLLNALKENGVHPEGIDIVILTHLHYDHSGGGIAGTDSGLAPTFTRAVYYLQSDEYNHVAALRKPDVEGYFPKDIEPLRKTGQLTLISGSRELLPGLKVYLAAGHCAGLQVVVVQSGNHTVFFPSDLFATEQHAHRNVFSHRSYDVEMLKQQRSKWLQAAVAGRWTCVFCHALKSVTGRLEIS